jgi:hypothetical protein
MQSQSTRVAEKIAHTLGIEDYKVKSSYKVHLWDAYFHQIEAILRSNHLGCAVLCREVVPFPVSLHPEIFTYKKILDHSQIIPRNNYWNDQIYDVKSKYISIFKTFILYVFALLIFPFTFFYPKKQQYNIAVQTLRKNVDLKSKSDLFWMNDNKLFSKTVLLFNNEHNKHGETKNIEAISLNIKHLFKKNIFFYNKYICQELLKSFFKFCKLSLLIVKEPHALVFVPYIFNVFKFNAVLKALDIKVFISNSSSYNSAALFACAISNVVYVRSTWSNQWAPHPHIATSADVFFAWGDTTIDTYSRSGAEGTTFVKTGHIDGNITSDSRSFSKKSPIEVGECIKLGFFDNNCSLDHANSISDMASCFQLLANLLLKHKNLIVIYKPKSGDNTEIVKAKSLTLLNKYIESKRFVIMTGEKGYENLPGQISKGLDLVIGFQISTAATESIIGGIPSFHINFTGSRSHFWELNGLSQFVFYNVNDAENKLSQYISMPNSIPITSDSLAKSVNHFLDFNAKARMQFYIQSLCECNKKSISKRIIYSNNLYNEKFEGDNGPLIVKDILSNSR